MQIDSYKLNIIYLAKKNKQQTRISRAQNLHSVNKKFKCQRDWHSIYLYIYPGIPLLRHLRFIIVSNPQPSNCIAAKITHIHTQKAHRKAHDVVVLLASIRNRVRLGNGIYTYLLLQQQLDPLINPERVVSLFSIFHIALNINFDVGSLSSYFFLLISP